MLERLFPRVADNRYRGHRLGLWLFGLMLLKIPMGANVMLNAPTVARTADGVPVELLGAGAPPFLFAFAAWGLCQLVLGLSCLVALVRYRGLVPLAFVALLIEQAVRMWLRFEWPVERVEAPGTTINWTLTGVMLAGLLLSLYRPRASAA